MIKSMSIPFPALSTGCTRRKCLRGVPALREPCETHQKYSGLFASLMVMLFIAWV
jgi:hypothetical protein